MTLPAKPQVQDQYIELKKAYLVALEKYWADKQNGDNQINFLAASGELRALSDQIEVPNIDFNKSANEILCELTELAAETQKEMANILMEPQKQENTLLLLCAIADRVCGTDSLKLNLYVKAKIEENPVKKRNYGKAFVILASLAAIGLGITMCVGTLGGGAPVGGVLIAAGVAALYGVYRKSSQAQKVVAPTPLRDLKKEQEKPKKQVRWRDNITDKLIASYSSYKRY